MNASSGGIDLRRYLTLVVALGVFLALWAVAAAHVPPYLLAGPGAVARRVAAFATDWSLTRHALASLLHVTTGLIAAFALGGTLATLAYCLPVFDRLVHGRISPALAALPGIALIILSLLWFGIGSTTVVFAIALTQLPFILIALREGYANLDSELVEMGHSFGRDRIRAFRLVILPSLGPFLFAALRISFGVSWKTALTAELFGGRAGLGFLFNRAAQSYDMETLLAVIMVIVVFVAVIDRCVFSPIQLRLERHHGRA